MALEHIEYGSLASSELMNDNFEYLDNRISNLAEIQVSDVSGLTSNIVNLNNTFSQQNENVVSELNELRDFTEQFKDEFDLQNNAPNYSQAIGISMPYTVTSDGYVYAGVDGIDTYRYVYVNGHKVHGHCGYSGGKAVYSGSLFRVSAGDIITCTRTLGEYYFYPMKGE